MFSDDPLLRLSVTPLSSVLAELAVMVPCPLMITPPVEVKEEGHSEETVRVEAPALYCSVAVAPYAIGPLNVFTFVPFSIEKMPLKVVVPDPKVTEPEEARVILLNIIPPLTAGVTPFKITVPALALKVPGLVRLPKTIMVPEPAVNVPLLVQLPLTVNVLVPVKVNEAPELMVIFRQTGAVMVPEISG